MKIAYFFAYCGLRLFGFLIARLPNRTMHAFGRLAGWSAYYLHRSFRKKALSNLAIAYGDKKSERERRYIAKRSFQNLMITCLEFFCLKKMKGTLTKAITVEGMEEADVLLQKKQGLIFLTGHQANWEIPFLKATSRFPGVAIGRPIKNKWLYNWVLSIREMHGGKIVMPKNAIRQGMRALKEGKFLGIVGDQAVPDSPYAYPLFGTRAWTSSAPALLAYKMNCPIVVCCNRRKKQGYQLKGSHPIWPNLAAPMKEEVPRLMDEAMRFLETSIEEKPEEWMWVHDRWKQQGIDHVKREYRYGFILITLPPDPTAFLPLIPLVRQIYPRSFLTFFAPEHAVLPVEGCEIHHYTQETDLFMRDWRYQLVLDFYGSKKLRRHFKKLGAFKALDLPALQKIAPGLDLAETLKQALVKRECLRDVSI